MVTIQVSVSKGWLHQQGNFTFSERYYFDPLFRWNQDRDADLFVVNTFPDLPIYNMESNLIQAKYFNPRQVLIGGIQPNMLLGMAVGARLNCSADKDSDIDSKPFETLNNTNELPKLQSLLESETIRLFDSQLETIKSEHPNIEPIPPFFWDSSGRATIHGLITTAQKLFGEKIFMTMIDDPKSFSEILLWITEAYILLIRHYSFLANINISSIHIGECSGTMISGDQFSENVVPFIDRFGEEFNSVRLHSCGYSDHLIEAFSKIKNLSIIDTGSRTSIAKIRSMLGNEFKINVAPPVECLVQSTDKHSIISWVDKTIGDNADGPLQIVFHIEPDYSIARCLLIFDCLQKKGISIKRIKYGC